MAKTPLFSRLRALAESVTGRDVEAQANSRREFMQQVLGALTAASLVGCDSEGDSDHGPVTNVAIVGGGMAGLMCARVLNPTGVQPWVFEASQRLGGRMFTARDGFAQGQLGELGGEFIDSGHMTLRMLAEELELTLDDRSADLSETTRADVWWVDGAAVPEETIVAQFSEVAPRWQMLLEQADDENDDTTYVMLDETSLEDFLNQECADLPELKSVLVNGYRGEYGREVSEQSALNLIYLIGADDPDPFRMFGVSDERFHTHAGNDALSSNADNGFQTRLGHKLVKVEPTDDSYTLHFETSGGMQTFQADFVVFALPFTMLREVDLSALALSADKQTIIRELGYGTNVKVMGSFTSRVWRTEHDALGGVTSDEPFQQCWDTSIGQFGESGLLTNFLGGKQGEAAAAQNDAEAWFTEVLVPGAEKVFPGAADAYVPNTAKAMYWPTAPFHKGSYACYAPGQWAFYGTEGLPEHDGKLQFCGEHTSLEFQGYMEGAAESGVLVASAILEKLEKSVSARHQPLVRLLRSVPQPFFGEDTRALGRRARLRARAEAYRKLVRGEAS